MPDFTELLAAAIQLPVDQRVRLIDELTDSLPETLGNELSPEWIEEIERRSAEIDAGAETVDWGTVRQDLFRRVGLDSDA